MDLDFDFDSDGDAKDDVARLMHAHVLLQLLGVHVRNLVELLLNVLRIYDNTMI
jgi:hypothetical protein